MSERAGQVAIAVLLLALPLSALVARRLPRGTLLWYGLAWIAIFAVALLIVRVSGATAG